MSDTYQSFCFKGKPQALEHKRPLTPQQERIYELLKKGMKPPEISLKLGISSPSVWDGIYKIKTNGWTYG